VFVAQDHRLARPVAIKVLPQALAATMSVDRFQREIMLAARLQHPHIVPVLSAGEMDNLPYFIMPFIYGESLRTRVTRGPLSVRETVGIMKDVAKALSYAHSHGVIHRDIKPDNVLLAAGTAVVTDFGVAKALSASRHQTGLATTGPITAVGFSAGTPAYMSPEQAAADPNVDGRTDIYALGVVGYEMLAGTPPFHGRMSQELLKAQLSETPPALAARRYDVPVALDKLISQCLEKDPGRRPKSASEIARALESAEYVSGAFAAPPSALARKKPRRLAMLAAALVVVAAGIFYKWNGPKAEEEVTPAVAAATSLGRSIAVLPLASTSPRDASLAAGTTAEIATSVSRVPGLRVASQTAVAGVADTNRQLTIIGARLGVTMLVEGSVQTSGKRVRINLRIVKVANDSTVWVERFDGTTDDIFAVQDAAARAVVTALVLRVR
jgi:serine/threonine-protein kinase